MKHEIAVLEMKLKAIEEEVKSLRPLAEKVRSFYKYQGTDNDISSEAFILSFESLSEVSYCISFLNELEIFEDDE